MRAEQSGWCDSAVATVVWERGHVPGGPARLSTHDMKSASISSSAQFGGLPPGNFVRSFALETRLATLEYRKACARWPHGCSHRNRKTTECKSVRIYLNLLPHPQHSPDFAPSDFLLFGPMNDWLRSQHVPDSSVVIVTVRRWVRFFKRIASGGDCGTIVFCSWKRALSNGVIVHSLSVVVSAEMNRRHYFWSARRICRSLGFLLIMWPVMKNLHFSGGPNILHSSCF
jgi:hypothetical protein